MAICNPGKESSQATNPASTLLLDFSDFRTVNDNFLLFQPPGLWYFVTQPELTDAGAMY